jgi:hypothetical protein
VGVDSIFFIFSSCGVDGVWFLHGEGGKFYLGFFLFCFFFLSLFSHLCHFVSFLSTIADKTHLFGFFYISPPNSPLGPYLVVFGTAASKLVCVSAYGRQLWTAGLDGPLYSPCAVTVLVPGNTGPFPANTGAFEPDLGPGAPCADPMRLLVVCAAGRRISAVRLADGAMVWESAVATTGLLGFSPPIICAPSSAPLGNPF